MIETFYENKMETTTFWIWAETFIHAIYIMQHKQPVYRLKMDKLMYK